jgi:hypothetical protein
MERNNLNNLEQSLCQEQSCLINIGLIPTTPGHNSLGKLKRLKIKPVIIDILSVHKDKDLSQGIESRVFFDKQQKTQYASNN